MEAHDLRESMPRHSSQSWLVGDDISGDVNDDRASSQEFALEYNDSIHRRVILVASHCPLDDGFNQPFFMLILASVVSAYNALYEGFTVRSRSLYVTIHGKLNKF